MPRALALAALAAAACAHAPPPAPELVTLSTTRGPVTGRQTAGLREFRAIPYAAPPVGPLRWTPPVPAPPWTRALAATTRGPACPQPTTGGYLRATAEDCLTLDLWTPAVAPAALPVLVWIHGGAFYQGSAGDDLYDGARLARRTGSVVVTVQYRLGALGWLGHPALTAERGRPQPSLGLLDQRAALQWVQDNIAAFGGDPDDVTIFGESAGAWSVCAHLASPGSRGLFARAIMQSGACSDALYFTPAQADAQGEALAAALGCGGEDVLECLREQSAEAVVGALPPRRGSILPPGAWWGPVIDGVDLPELPLAAIRGGRAAPVPLLLGWNRDEGVLHTVGFDAVTEAERDGFVREAFGAEAVARLGPLYRRETPKASLTDVITDGVFACNARRVARAHAARDLPVYLYLMTHPLDAPAAHALGATHSIELFFVWGNEDLGIGLSAAEQDLAHTFMDAWGRFAKSGDPSGPGLAWPRYTLASDAHQVLDTVTSTGTGLKRAACDAWDAAEGPSAR